MTQRRTLRALLALAVPAALAALLLGPAAPAHAAGSKLYVADEGTDSVAVVDTASNTITANIPVVGPEYTAATPDGQVFVTSNHAVSVISTSSNTVTATIPIDSYVPADDVARQITVDPAGAFAYVVTEDGYVLQISTATDTVTGTVRAGEGTPAMAMRAMAISPDGATLYVSGDSSSVSVVDTATLTVRSVIYTGDLRSWAIAVAPDGSHVYVAYNHDFALQKSVVDVISTATNQLTARIPVATYTDGLQGIAVTPDGGSVYVTASVSNTVSVISTATNTVTTTISGLAGPVAIALNSTGTTAWVSNVDAGNGYVAVIDTATNTVTSTIPGFSFPFGLTDTTSQYEFTGFLPPVGAQPTVNQAHAGQAIPLKFSLNGDQGLSIFSTGSPAVQQVDCATGAPVNTDTLTDTAGGSGLQYDAASDTYTYVWKTSKDWAGTCQQFSLGLNDGSTHTATFQFQ